MTSDNTPTPTGDDSPVTPPVTTYTRATRTTHDYQPTTMPGMCGRCMQPLEADLHPHRFEPTLTRPYECMCGDEADAEQHTGAQPARGGIYTGPRLLVDPDRSPDCGPLPTVRIAGQPAGTILRAEHLPALPPSVTVRITGTDNGPKPTPLLLARPRLARLRDFLRRAGDTR
ncbi:hypothetical protein [Peterkaempfera sp. SMS 1(5)a]|uniref:hypothetical protein n=1 Tax=Peterkaempfera podocarpi TaxID=3232308 RepID=UPI00366D9AFD